MLQEWMYERDREEMCLAIVSVPESNFLAQKTKIKVQYLFNRNFGKILKKLLTLAVITKTQYTFVR